MQLIKGQGEVIKCCAGCQETWTDMREISRAFGKDDSRADGFQPYCKACRRRRRYFKLGQYEKL